MKEKRNIDKLFKEGFKNFEPTPSARVWENIKAELDKEKRNRKPIPLWIKYGGIAALLALCVTVGNWVFTPSPTVPNTITHEKFVDPSENINDNPNSNNKKSISPVVTEQNNVLESYSSEENFSAEEITTKNKLPKKKSTVSSVASKDSEAQPLLNEEYQNRDSEENNLVPISPSDNKIANNNTASDDTAKMGERPAGKDETKTGLITNRDSYSEKIEERIAAGKVSEKGADSLENEIVPKSENKISILEAIAQDEKSDLVSSKNENPLPENRWSVTPNVAPVYYGSLGNGSSIDQDFSNNPQNGDVNLSYGLKVSYAINNRLSIRTGLNNMDLSYSTSDIVIGTGPVAMALRSVDYGSKQIVVTALARETLNNHPSANFENITLKSTGGDARLIQNINYYEIPLELKYAVIDSKLGINVIGGVSTLFLGNNEISVKSENFSSVLGEANNLSDVSFSTNVGLGIDYKLSKRFVFNIEPMFKYQLNPYTDSTVNFKPYYLGVYSGLSFKF